MGTAKVKNYFGIASRKLKRAVLQGLPSSTTVSVHISVYRILPIFNQHAG